MCAVIAPAPDRAPRRPRRSIWPFVSPGRRRRKLSWGQRQRPPPSSRSPVRSNHGAAAPKPRLVPGRPGRAPGAIFVPVCRALRRPHRIPRGGPRTRHGAARLRLLYRLSARGQSLCDRSGQLKSVRAVRRVRACRCSLYSVIRCTIRVVFSSTTRVPSSACGYIHRDICVCKKRARTRAPGKCRNVNKASRRHLLAPASAARVTARGSLSVYTAPAARRGNVHQVAQLGWPPQCKRVGPETPSHVSELRIQLEVMRSAARRHRRSATYSAGF